jgi:hypothetical protein
LRSDIYKDGRGNFRTKKDKDATLDYPFDWSEFLTDGDQITSFNFSTTGTLVVESSTHVGPIVTAFVSGGEVGAKTGKLICTVETVQGRIDDKELIFDIDD